MARRNIPVPVLSERQRRRLKSCTFENCVGSDYTTEETEFLRAIDRYKVLNRRPYPSWREVLAVVRALGYRKPPPD